MVRTVTITQLSDTITCTPEGSGSVKFTITNTCGKRLRVTTANPDEGGNSASQIPMNSGTHIAYVKNGNQLQLYVNGNLDAQVPLVGNSVSNNGPLYLGKDPWYPGINGSLDDIRIYDRALPAEVLRVLAEGKSQ